MSDLNDYVVSFIGRGMLVYWYVRVWKFSLNTLGWFSFESCWFIPDLCPRGRQALLLYL